MAGSAIDGGWEGNLGRMVSDACGTGVSACSKVLSFLSFGIGSDDNPQHTDKKNAEARSVVFINSTSESPFPENKEFSPEILQAASQAVSFNPQKSIYQAQECSLADVKAQLTPVAGLDLVRARQQEQLAVA